MDRFSKLFCDPVKVIKSIILLSLCLGIILYVYFQTISGFDSDIVTETSMLVSLNDSVSADAYIFRDETVIDKSSSGAVVTLVSEGDRVSKGQLLANIYPDAKDVVLQDEINRIDRKLDILNSSEIDSEYVVSDLSDIDKNIGEIFADIYSDSSKGNLSSAIRNSSELIVSLNKRDLVVDSEFDHSDEVKRLEREKSELEGRISSSSSSVYATSAGYFYGDVDGYEESFDVSAVAGISLAKIDELSSKEPDERLLQSGAVKIVNDFVWYVVCSVDSSESAKLSEGYNYYINFPENGDAQMRMRLERIVSETTSPTALAVFRSNVLPADFDYKRFQKAEIVLDSVQGLSVPKKALRVVDGVNGVYILVGDVIRYRKVDIIDEKDNYYIVKYITDNDVFEEDTDANSPANMIENISLYDNIIVSGKDLFDGKIAV